MATLTNDLTNEYREVNWFTAFLGSFFFGPFYFTYKGMWGHGLLQLVTFNWFVIGGFFVVPFMAAGLVTDYYRQRNFHPPMPKSWVEPTAERAGEVVGGVARWVKAEPKVNA